MRITEEVLDAMFSRIGYVQDCVVKHYELDVSPHRQTGYGFVYFTHQEDALRAIRHFKQQTVDGVYFDCNACFAAAPPTATVTAPQPQPPQPAAAHVPLPPAVNVSLGGRDDGHDAEADAESSRKAQEASPCGEPSPTAAAMGSVDFTQTHGHHAASRWGHSSHSTASSSTTTLTATGAPVVESVSESLVLVESLREELDAQVSAAIARGDTERAAQTLRHALTLHPDDEALTRRLQQLEAASRSDDIDRIVQAAKGHERAGRWELAAQTWARAASQHAQEYSFHLYAAQAYCESGNELPKAVDLARRAARLRPEAVEPHVCLARAFFRAGSIASAKAALEQATKLAPQNPAVLELARQLRI